MTWKTMRYKDLQNSIFTIEDKAIRETYEANFEGVISDAKHQLEPMRGIGIERVDFLLNLQVEDTTFYIFEEYVGHLESHDLYIVDVEVMED